MSLKKAAKYLESKGRNGDSMLVHMTPGEVKGLQALALAHGGSLSVNPHTGLVEASFLKQILPVVAGAALTGLSGGMINPATAGMLMGGFETLRTGDLGKGLMAGMGAYGGAGLGSALTAAGGEAAASAIANPTANATAAYQKAMESGLGGEAAQQAFMQSSNIPQNPMLAGLKQVTSSPEAGLNFAKNNLMNIGAAAAPIVSDVMTPKTPAMPGAPEEDPRYKGAPYNYRLSSNFSGYTPATPNPYYRPAGLGYAAGGEVEHYELGGRVPRMSNMIQGIIGRMRGDRDIPGLSDDFQAYIAPRPEEYYTPRGLGYADGGAVGSFDDETGIDGYADGGSLGGYSDGGRMLKGPGDGMSDSIPGVIGGRQPARLADGEFVVPADVVSHLGNGSTDAGAKRLYSMMDKVRKARTGTKKQGKQIKPEKYMPA